MDIPAGFKPNLGNVSETVTLSMGERVIPQFVQWLGTGEVEMVVGQEGNEPVYVAQLCLKPDYGQAVADPIPYWFSDLLTSLGDKFNTLTWATYELPEWAAHAEIMRYHCIDDNHHELEEQISILKGWLSINNEALDACHYCIKAANLPHRLQNLRGRSNFPIQCVEQVG